MTETAFLALYERTARPLKAFLTRLTGEPSLAEELLQESYYRMWRGGFDESAGEDAARAYLYRTAANLARDHFRRGPSRSVSIDANTDDDRRCPMEPAAPAVDIDARLDARRVLATLAPRERKMLWLAYGEGLSHREIAASTGVQEGSVRPLLYRLRQRLGLMLAGPRAALASGDQAKQGGRR
jgi:RNA polymerase sigma-70 factor (ECF subfamily)